MNAVCTGAEKQVAWCCVKSPSSNTQDQMHLKSAVTMHPVFVHLSPQLLGPAPHKTCWQLTVKWGITGNECPIPTQTNREGQFEFLLSSISLGSRSNGVTSWGNSSTMLYNYSEKKRQYKKPPFLPEKTKKKKARYLKQRFCPHYCIESTYHITNII